MKTATRILHSFTFLILMSVSLCAQWVQVQVPVGDEISAIMARIDANDTSIFVLKPNGQPTCSTDNGATWKPIANAPRTPCMISHGSYVFMAQGYMGVARLVKGGSGWTRETSVQVVSGSFVNTIVSKGTSLFVGVENWGMCRSTDNGTSWSVAGLSGKSVQSLAVSGSRIFAGTKENGVFVSTDDGAHWEQATAGIPDSSITSLTVSPATSGSGAANIFAVTSHGVFVSKNNGSSWTSANSGLPPISGYENAVNGLAVIGAEVYAALAGGGVFVSRNDGASWADVTNNLPDLKVNCVATAGTRLYAGTTACDMYLSTDHGASWTQATTGGSYSFGASALDSYQHPDGSGTTVLAATRNNIFRSTDRGATWKASNKGLGGLAFGGDIYTFGFCPNSSAFTGMNIFLGTQFGLYVSTDDGASWSDASSGFPVDDDIHTLLATDNYMYAGMRNGRVFVSSDGGSTWSSTNTGMPNAIVSSLVAFPAAGGVGEYLFAGTIQPDLLSSGSGGEPGRGVFLTTNHGATWNEVNAGLIDLDVRCLAMLGTDLYAGVTNGAYRSTNNGATWTGANNGLPSQQLSNNQIRTWPVYSLVASGPNLFAGSRDGGIYLSTNNGTNWTTVKQGGNIYTGDAGPLSHMFATGQDLWALSDGLVRRPLAEMVPTAGNLTVAYTPIDASAFPQIRTLLTVNDATNAPIGDLSSANVAVKEDGVTESPVTVTSVGSGGSRASILLAFDKGEGMGSVALDHAKELASEFVRLLKRDDSLAVLSFDTQTTLNVPFTTNITAALEEIHGLSAAKSSAIYDALYESIRQTKDRTGSRAIVLFSAGNDYSVSHGKDQIFQYAITNNIPVYVIGFPTGSAGEGILHDIAKATDGAFYRDPGGSGLTGIYQSITQAVKNQYRVTYTSHRPAADASTRTVTINVTYKNNYDSQQKQYTAPSSTTASSIAPSGSALVPVGLPFWVDVRVGDPNTVKDLYGVSFRLKSGTTSCTYVVGSGTAGSFLGSGPLTLFQTVDAQTVSASVTKTAAPGISGTGTVARFQFTTPSSLSSTTNVTFAITNVQANDASGAAIPMSVASFAVAVSPASSVWPGDCDNSNSVNAADLLPIGLYYGQKNSTTATANNPGIIWQAYKRTFWTSDSLGKRLYADADGNGIIDGADVLAIGLNYGKARSVAGKTVVANSRGAASLQQAEGKLEVGAPIQASGDLKQVRVPIILNTASPLYGIAFTLKSPAGTKFISVDTTGQPLGDALMISSVSDGGAGIEIGMTRTKGPGYQGTGTLLTVEAELPAAEARSIDIDIPDIIATDASGNTIIITGTSYHGPVAGPGQSSLLPTEYGLSQNYPNPFNPSTSLEYRIVNPGFVSLKIFDVLGREVASLVNEIRSPGIYTVQWDAAGQTSGIYFCLFQAGGHVETKRMVLLK